MKTRLDKELSKRRLVSTRSQAESFVRMGEVYVNGEQTTKPGRLVDELDDIEVRVSSQYVSRAAYKLASVADIFRLSFKGKTVLDIGSSTGGFTDFALQHGARKVVCVEVGTDQLHHSLRSNPRVELHEKTDIRSLKRGDIDVPDIVVVDVSFISLLDIAPHLCELISIKTQVVAMAKPQFEAGERMKNKGIIKNERLRRDILGNLEIGLKRHFVIHNKQDSGVSGEKGNQERFYLLTLAKQ